MDMGRLRQRVVFDRYLARLFTVFGTAIVLKGDSTGDARARKGVEADL